MHIKLPYWDLFLSYQKVSQQSWQGRVRGGLCSHVQLHVAYKVFHHPQKKYLVHVHVFP